MYHSIRLYGAMERSDGKRLAFLRQGWDGMPAELAEMFKAEMKTTVAGALDKPYESVLPPEEMNWSLVLQATEVHSNGVRKTFLDVCRTDLPYDVATTVENNVMVDLALMYQRLGQAGILLRLQAMTKA